MVLKTRTKNVNHKAEEWRLQLSNWILLLEFSNLKGRLGGEMKTFIYLYISKWFKDDWTCRKTYSLIRKLAVLLWYTDCQWSLSLLLQSSVLSTFQQSSFIQCLLKLYRWCRSPPDKVLLIVICDIYLSKVCHRSNSQF